MTLARLQTRLHACVAAGAPADDVRPLFTPVARRRLERGLAVYAAGARHRTLLRLLAVFARTARLLGSEPFEALVREHCAQAARPFAELAHGLPDFLASAGVRRDAADVARLEWARDDVSRRPDSPALGIEALGLQGAGLGSARFEFTRALRLVATACDVGAVWAALDSGATTPGPSRARGVVHLVWAGAGMVRHRALEPCERQALESALGGEALDQICEPFRETQDPAGAAHAALRAWFDDGLVSAVVPCLASFTEGRS